MGLIGVIIAVIILIIIFAFSYLSNSPATITPEKSEQIQTEAQEIMNKAEEKARLDEGQIKNIDTSN